MKFVLCVRGQADFQKNEFSLDERAKLVPVNVLRNGEKDELSDSAFISLARLL